MRLKNKVDIHYSSLLLLFTMAYSGLYFEIVMFFLTIILHEGGHILTARLFGCRTGKITLTIFGGIAQINMNGLAKIKRIIVLLSGVIVNIILFFLIRNPYIKEYNLLLIIFNLLPIYPLDGYQILDSIFLNFRSVKMIKGISFFFISLLFIASILLSSLGLFIITVYLFIKNFKYYRSDYYLLRKVFLSFPFFLTNFTKNIVYNSNCLKKLEKSKKCVAIYSLLSIDLWFNLKKTLDFCIFLL